MVGWWGGGVGRGIRVGRGMTAERRISGDVGEQRGATRGQDRTWHSGTRAMGRPLQGRPGLQEIPGKQRDTTQRTTNDKRSSVPVALSKTPPSPMHAMRAKSIIASIHATPSVG